MPEFPVYAKFVSVYALFIFWINRTVNLSSKCVGKGRQGLEFQNLIKNMCRYFYVVLKSPIFTFHEKMMYFLS